MLMLAATTDTIAVATSNGTGGAYDVDMVGTFIDRVTSTGAIGAATRQLANMTSATEVNIVDSPAADTTRKVKYINIRNAHATASVEVLVHFWDDATAYEIHKATLLAGESLCYLEKVGFFKLVDTTRLERNFIVASQQTFATAATFADIVGLTCPMKANVMYGILACIIHLNNASTTGSWFAYNIGAAPTSSLMGTIDTVTPSTSAAAMSGGAIQARDTAFTAQTTGSTGNRLAIIAGYIVPSADGTFAIRASSEVTVAGGLVVQAGSWLRVFRPTG